MKTILLLLTSLLFLNFSNFYKFKVYDENKEPIAILKVHITSPDVDMVVYTNFDGVFEVPKSVNHKEAFVTFYHKALRTKTMPLSNLSETEIIVLKNINDRTRHNKN